MASPGAPRRSGTEYEYAYERLAEMILSGDIAAGTPISQVDLAEEIGVSRTPLREASRLLQREGLLVGEPNRRLRAADVTLEDLDELYSVRISVESLALQLAVPRMDDDHVSGLEEALDELERMGAEGRDADEPHRRFHLQLVAPAGTRFENLGSSLWDHSIRYRSACLASGPGSPELEELIVEGARDHRAILAAVRRGDGSGAAAILAGHYAQTARFLAGRIDGDHTLEAVAAALGEVGDA